MCDINQASAQPGAPSFFPTTAELQQRKERRALRRAVGSGAFDDLLDYQNEQSRRSYLEDSPYFDPPSDPTTDELRQQANDRQIQDVINTGVLDEGDLAHRNQEVDTVFTNTPWQDRDNIARIIQDNREADPSQILDANVPDNLPEIFRIVLANRSGIEDQGIKTTPAALRQRGAKFGSAPGSGPSLAFGGGEKLGSSVFSLPVTSSNSSTIVR